MGGPTSYLRGMYEGDGIRGRGEVLRAVVATGGCRTTAKSHIKIYFSGSVGEATAGIREAWWGWERRVGFFLWKWRLGKSRAEFFWYVGTDTGDARVGGWSHSVPVYNVMAWEAVHWTAGGEGGAGPISKLCNNKRRSLGPEWSMSRVGNSPPHNSEKPPRLVAINNNNNNNNNNNKTHSTLFFPVWKN